MECYLDHMAEMFSSVTKELWFWPHFWNTPLALKEKLYFGRMAGMFPSCYVRNLIPDAWQKCYILIANVTVHSAHGWHIADRSLRIITVSVVSLPCQNAMILLPHFCNGHVTNRITRNSVADEKAFTNVPGPPELYFFLIPSELAVEN